MEPEPKATGDSPPGAYEELRRLLLPEGEELSRLHGRMSDPLLRAEDLSEVLPPALRMEAARGPELRLALLPLVEEAIRTSIQKKPALLAQALFPIIFAAFRKAIASAFRNGNRRIRRFAERNLTFRGLRWRWESYTSGKPFAGLVLIHSRLYRVEQVFLIHRETGLLLQECGDESGMLPAVQDFVSDSINGHPSHDDETFRAGDRDIWIRHRSHAILAAVIRGTAPRQLRNVLERCLERIQDTKAAELVHFDGNTSLFNSCREGLAECLIGQAPAEPSAPSPLWWLAAAILLELVGYWIFTNVREHRRWEDYLARLQNQPGIAVTGVQKHGNGYIVSGLRDPLAVDPASLLPGTGIDAKNVSFHWELYHSLQPAFEAERRLLNQRQTIENYTLHFGPGSSDLAEEDIATLDQIAQHMRALLLTAKDLNRMITMEVIGHTDGTPLEEKHDRLAQIRADAVRRALIEAGVPEGALAARGAGASQPLRPGNSDTDKLFNRYVSFHITP